MFPAIPFFYSIENKGDNQLMILNIVDMNFKQVDQIY